MKRGRFLLTAFLILFITSAVTISCKEKKEPDKSSENKEVKKEAPKKKKDEEKQEDKKKPKPKPVVVPEKKNKVYTVKQDDWLWKISRNEYGTALGWEKIYQANKEKIKNPNLIFPGQKLVIPE